MTRKVVDWESVEGDFRAGLLSLREMAAAHGVSHVAIAKKAKAAGWTRDLAAKIKAKADALVNRAAVNTEVNERAEVTERQIIEANAERIAQVRNDHRVDIVAARSLAMTLLQELRHQTDQGDLYEQLFELLTDPEAEEEGANERAKERQRKRREIFERALSLGGRTKTMKDLAETLRTLIGLERQAFGIDQTTAGSGDYEAELERVHKQIGVAF